VSERTYLTALCANLLEEQEKWAHASDSVIDEGFAEAAAEIIEAFSTHEIPVGMEPLAAHVAGFARHWKAFRGRIQDGDELALPTPETYVALNEIHQACAIANAGPPKVVESIKTLTDQKVPDAQICRIYEWIDPAGTIETWKLQEELATPGRHVSEDFVHPREKARRMNLEGARRNLDDLQRRCYLKTDALTATAPEALEDLVKQGISGRQACRMLRITPQDLLTACDKAGLECPPMDYDSPQTVRAPHEEELSPEAERSFDAGKEIVMGGDKLNAPKSSSADVLDGEEGPPMTIEQQVIALHEGGNANSEIVETLNGISRQKVASVIKRFKKNPELFG